MYFIYFFVFHICFQPSPLFRVISRAPGLKLVVETLITSLKPIGNIVLICCAFFIIFGILGVQVGQMERLFLMIHTAAHWFPAHYYLFFLIIIII